MINDDKIDFVNGLSKNSKELTREQLYSVLIGKFHDDVWHCSRTEDGLVEIQFYVKEN